MAGAIKIPVARPLLPDRAAIAGYLDEIDANRWYSNFGPLCLRFEARLAERYGVAAQGVATVANATLGLVVALQAVGARPGSHCIIPSWTFSASVHAIVAAGLIPLFVDVDDQGVLTPDIARRALDGAEAIGAVVPVSVNGRPIDPGPWEAFQAETGLPVVIDAAPAFDGARASRLLTVVSLHATKILGVGEGGFILSTDLALVAAARLRTNFGFYGSREAQIAATNGKISEYAAALGLAGLDGWAQRRAAFQRVAARYRAGLAAVPGAELLAGFGDDWLTATCIVRVDRPAASLVEALTAAGIETRAWWGEGMHPQPPFRRFPRRDLAMTAALAATTVGLPFYLDMPDDAVDEVVAAIGRWRASQA
jgi:dTDP-4-amino-4,6-dideoxygalactose transaminase